MAISRLYFVYFLAGALLGLATFIELGWVVAMFGLSVFLFGLKSTHSSLEVLIGSLLTFLTKSLIVTSVFYSLYPLDWLPISSTMSLFLVLFYWFYSALGATLGGLFVGLAWWFILKLRTIYKLILLPLVWVFGEWLGSYFYSVLMMGEGVASTLKPSAGFLGHTLVYHSSLFNVAGWGGVYSLSLVLVGLVVLLSCLWQIENNTYRKKLFFITLLILAVTSLDIFSGSIRYKLPTLAVVETDFKAGFLRDDQSLDEAGRNELLFKAVTAAIQVNPDFILLPEDARFISGSRIPSQALGFYQFAFSGPSSILIDSARTETLQGVFLRASIYSPKEAKVWQADKQSLIPFGEYLPRSLSVLLSFIEANEEQSLARQRLIYRPGPLNDQSIFSDNVPGIIFCFESLDPLAVWRLKRDRELPFVAHLVSHAWFNSDGLLKRLVEAPLLAQARLSNTPIISAANASVSKIYWPSGLVEIPPVIVEGDGWRVRLVSADSR